MQFHRHPHRPAAATNQDGSISIIAIVASAALIASAALSVDVGTFFLVKRKQQTATDIAAMVAARQLGQARQVITQALVANGFDPGSLQTLEYGTYQANPQIAPAQRFQTSDPAVANAVRVTVKSVAPMYFGSALFPPASAAQLDTTPGMTVQTQATAAQADFASFAIGSQLASLNGGLLNSLLGSLLGGKLNLSVMDYQSLASAHLDLFTFSNLLATRLGLRTVSYGQLAAASIHSGDILLAAADAIRAGGGSTAVAATLTQIANATTPSSSALTLGSILDFGPFSTLTVGIDGPITAGVTALDMLTMVAEVAGKGHLVSLDLTGTLPGLTSVTLMLAIGAPPAQSSFVAMNRVGAQVRTAQTRLYLSVQVPALAPLLSLKLPLYIQVASSTATLSSLSCGPGANVPAATLAVQPSLADVWIGDVSSAAFSNFGQSPSVQPVGIASVLGIAGIYARAHVAVGNSTATQVNFSAADIAGQVKHTTSTTDFTASLIQSLTSSLQLSLTPTGTGLIPPPIPQLIAQSLGPIAPVLDQTVSGLLSVLGLQLGDADSWITGVRCGGSVLVN